MFSRTTGYALSALTLLARIPDQVVPAPTLARTLGLPANYMGKTFRRLQDEGLAEAVRGRGGGFRLGRPADEITLAQVVEAMEPLDHSAQCLMGKGSCHEEGACPAHRAWREASAPVFRFLEHHTLADLASEPDPRPHPLVRAS